MVNSLRKGAIVGGLVALTLSAATFLISRDSLPKIQINPNNPNYSQSSPKKDPENQIIYTEIGEPINLKKKSKETMETKFYLGNYNPNTNLSKEEFYHEIKELDKKIELKTLFDLEELSTIGRLIARNVFKKTERWITKKEIIEDFLEISKDLENYNGYSSIDTKNLEAFLNLEGILLEEYPKGSILTIDSEGTVLNIHYDPETGEKGLNDRLVSVR